MSITTTPAPPVQDPPALSAGPLGGALLESRQRWRDLVALSADLAFETDSWGRFTFITPDPALGWGAATLIGQPARLLLAEAAGEGGFDPFRPLAPVRRRRAWLRRPDGTAICLAFAAAPLLDAAGRIVGARGVGQDVTEQDGYDAAVAGALRRGEVVDHILWRMRDEVVAQRMMHAALAAMATAMGAEGAAVIDAAAEAVVLHQTCPPTPAVLRTAQGLLEASGSGPAEGVAPDGRGVLACPSQRDGRHPVALLLWRTPESRGWDADDLVLATSASGIIRVVLAHEEMQREMLRQARTDPLTGLLNRRAFMDELDRRIERLDREGLPGTLVFVDIDNFKHLNDARGHDAGDEALMLTAELLRATVRPSDLVARLGGDEFVLWLDGADDLTAAERAESLRLNAPRALADITEGYCPRLTLSIGIATRRPGDQEELESLLNRADQAMYEVKRNGRAHWRVSHPKAPA